MQLPNDALWHAFESGHRFITEDGQEVSARVEDAGPLVLPSGRIVVSDPVLDPWNKPLAFAAAPGAYPVLLSIIENEVALVMVHLKAGTPVRWKPTRPKTFVLDSATGGVMDYKVSRFLRRKAETNTYDKYVRRFQGAMEENGGLWGNYCIDPRSGANAVMFHTWGGDGVFPSFLGFDASHEIVCVTIDTYLCQDHVVGSLPPSVWDG